MRIAFFSAHPFEKAFFEEESAHHAHHLTYFESALSEQTAPLAQGFDAVCCFVTDQLNAPVLRKLSALGVRLIALRSAGYNKVDLPEAARLSLPVVRVPAYSPHAVAEHAVGLLLCLNRKIHKAYARVREQNFSLEGLMGFDLFGKTVGVVGTGRIGSAFAQIMRGFGCNVLGYDPEPSAELVKTGVLHYAPLDSLFERSDVLSLHSPLLPETKHLVDARRLGLMKPGAILINTGRGGLIDSSALIDALKSGHLGGAALDVYEEEDGVFFENLSERVIQDDVLVRLMTFPHVLLTAHQAFFTQEALSNIAQTTLQNISDFQARRPLLHEVRAETHLAQTAALDSNA